jgi:uncharacterized protein YbjT (DUF2867 family)
MYKYNFVFSKSKALVMKIVLTGSLGNISKPLATILIKAGHEVTIISSNKDKVPAIKSLGAVPAIGSINDTDFLTKTFKGADVIYTMVPPNFAATSMKGYIADSAKGYAEAIRASGVQHIVNLSSIGAHLESGTGPIAGLHQGEIALNALKNVNITHLRPGYFYTNFFGNSDMIRQLGFVGSNYGEKARLIMAHPNDIAEAAAEEIQAVPKGHKVRYIVSDDRTANDIAKAIGTAINKPDLKWVEFTNEQALGGMTQAGLPEEIAKNYVEMGSAIAAGVLWEDYVLNKSKHGKIKLEDFAKEFAAAYNRSA